MSSPNKRGIDKDVVGDKFRKHTIYKNNEFTNEWTSKAKIASVKTKASNPIYQVDSPYMSLCALNPNVGVALADPPEKGLGLFATETIKTDTLLSFVTGVWAHTSEMDERIGSSDVCMNNYTMNFGDVIRETKDNLYNLSNGRCDFMKTNRLAVIPKLVRQTIDRGRTLCDIAFGDLFVCDAWALVNYPTGDEKANAIAKSVLVPRVDTRTKQLIVYAAIVIRSTVEIEKGCELLMDYAYDSVSDNQQNHEFVERLINEQVEVQRYGYDILQSTIKAGKDAIEEIATMRNLNKEYLIDLVTGPRIVPVHCALLKEVTGAGNILYMEGSKPTHPDQLVESVFGENHINVQYEHLDFKSNIVLQVELYKSLTDMADWTKPLKVLSNMEEIVTDKPRSTELETYIAMHLSNKDLPLYEDLLSLLAEGSDEPASKRPTRLAPSSPEMNPEKGGENLLDMTSNVVLGLPETDDATANEVEELLFSLLAGVGDETTRLESLYTNNAESIRVLEEITMDVEAVKEANDDNTWKKLRELHIPKQLSEHNDDSAYMQIMWSIICQRNRNAVAKLIAAIKKGIDGKTSAFRGFKKSTQDWSLLTILLDTYREVLHSNLVETAEQLHSGNVDRGSYTATDLTNALHMIYQNESPSDITPLGTFKAIFGLLANNIGININVYYDFSTDADTETANILLNFTPEDTNSNNQLSPSTVNLCLTKGGEYVAMTYGDEHVEESEALSSLQKSLMTLVRTPRR